MSSFFPCCESGSCNHRHIPNRNLVVLCTRSLQHCKKLCVHPWGANRFRRILETAKIHHQESIHHWLSDRFFHLLFHMDQSSMGMCSLQPLRPRSSPSTQTAWDYSWHQDPNLQLKMSLRNCHTFVHFLRAIHHDSSHHSIHQDSIHHESMNRQWDMFEQIREFPSLSLISSFQDLRDQFSMFLPLCDPLAPLVPLENCQCRFLSFWMEPLDFPFDFSLLSLLFPLPSLLDHDRLCLPLPDECLPMLLRALQSRWKCAPPHLLKHPSRGLDDPFPLPDERELTASTSMGSDCPRDPVSLGLESRIIKPNFVSQRSIHAWSSRREHRPGEMIVRRRFRFLPPVVGSCLVCSLRHASNGFIRELVTMSFTS